MSFEKILRIPTDRIAVLIGKSGNVKSKIEDLCHVTLDINGESGEVFITSNGNVEDIEPFKAMEIVIAIGRGFSPDNALNLLKGENALHKGKQNTISIDGALISTCHIPLKDDKRTHQVEIEVFQEHAIN